MISFFFNAAERFFENLHIVLSDRILLVVSPEKGTEELHFSAGICT